MESTHFGHILSKILIFWFSVEYSGVVEYFETSEILWVHQKCDEEQINFWNHDDLRNGKNWESRALEVLDDLWGDKKHIRQLKGKYQT